MARARLVLPCLLCHLALAAALRADDATDLADAEQRAAAATRWLAAVDEILQRHIDPPTRREMIRRGVAGMFAQNGAPGPRVGRRLSGLADDQLPDFLAEMIDAAQRASSSSIELLQTAFLSNVLPVGEVDRYTPASEYRVQRQLRDNRYVGIGIALSNQQGRPAMHQVFPRGPAHQAGGKAGDLILSIDGVDTADMSLQESVERLRGREGEPLTVVVQQPGGADRRTLEMIRSVVPFETLEGRQRKADDEWDYRAEPDLDIAYLKLKSIRGSTLQELEQAARHLQSGSYQALILDLRYAEDGELRHTVMLADRLLGQCPLGSVTDSAGTRELHSDAQRLLADMPMVVLADATTQGGAAWIAAALHDAGRAELIGQVPAAVYSSELIELPVGTGAMLMPTALLRPAQPRPNAVKPRSLRTRVTPGFPAPPRDAAGAIRSAIEVLKRQLAD